MSQRIDKGPRFAPAVGPGGSARRKPAGITPGTSGMGPPPSRTAQSAMSPPPPPSSTTQQAGSSTPIRSYARAAPSSRAAQSSAGSPGPGPSSATPFKPPQLAKRTPVSIQPGQRGASVGPAQGRPPTAASRASVETSSHVGDSEQVPLISEAASRPKTPAFSAKSAFAPRAPAVTQPSSSDRRARPSASPAPLPPPPPPPPAATSTSVNATTSAQQQQPSEPDAGNAHSVVAASNTSMAKRTRAAEPDAQEDTGRPEGDASKRKRPSRPKRPEGFPIRPPTAYFMFVHQNRQRFKDANPNATAPEMAKLSGSEWGRLEESERANWQNQAKEATRRYRDEVKQWRRDHPDEIGRAHV